ncbi:hypothetical protein DRP05_09955 [Archaeoglobales archaeon]|nr:MAG: hypothetical protein DRP05_09955 [Archaeoglobales archaeon]
MFFDDFSTDKVIVALIAIGGLVYGGVLWWKSQLSPEQQKQGKRYVTASLILLAIDVLAWRFADVIIKLVTGSGGL